MISRVAVRDALLVALIASVGVAVVLWLALTLLGWRVNWPVYVGWTVACFVVNASLNLYRLRRRTR